MAQDVGLADHEPNAHRYAPAPILAPFGYTQIIWMAAIGYLVFADLPDVWTVVGALVVIGSGLYLLHRERIHARSGKIHGDGLD